VADSLGKPLGLTPAPAPSPRLPGATCGISAGYFVGFLPSILPSLFSRPAPALLTPPLHSSPLRRSPSATPSTTARTST